MTYFGTNKEKKAIIILPGFAASGLYGVEDDRKYWDPLENNHIEYNALMNPVLLAQTDLSNVITEVLGRLSSFVNDFSLNEDGIPNIEMRGANKGESGEYGTLNIYKEAVLSLQQDFGSEYDVVLFNTDFRRNVEYSVDNLEAFLKQKSYKEVIFIGHSMGGMIASNFLARSQENRDLVKLNVACAVPFYGTQIAIAGLDSPVELVSLFMPDGLTSILSLLGVNAILKDVFENMGGIFDLIPNQNLLDDPIYDNAPFFTVDGVALNYEEFLEYIGTRSFALKKDGETIKPMLSDFISSYNNYYVNGVHSTKLINSHYIVGTGIDTLKTLAFNNGSFDMGNSSFTDGDLLVTPFVGALGLPLDSANVSSVEAEHNDLISVYSNIEEIISTLIKSL